MRIADTQPKVVFMGMRSLFSCHVLAGLLAEGIAVQAVIVPGTREVAAQPAVRPLSPPDSASELPLLTRFVQPDTVQLAWEHGIPAFEIIRLSNPKALDLLRSWQPDVIAVACFNQRFPSELLHLPPYGCVNVHPSLLPAYRGPAPLFWVFRNGEDTTGVTVHLMDEGLDSGDVLLQKRVAIPEGISGETLERRCALIGAELMARALRELRAGTLRPRKQQDAESSYYPWPEEKDFVISTARSARWAFRFMRGVAHWGVPFPIEVAGQRLYAREAVSYTPDGRLGAPFVATRDGWWVQCTPGTLRVRRW